MSTTISAPLLATALRRELLRLARAEDERAAEEAAQVPYWAGYPPSVQGHRAAAAILRADADNFLNGADYAG